MNGNVFVKLSGWIWKPILSAICAMLTLQEYGHYAVGVLDTIVLVLIGAIIGWHAGLTVALIIGMSTTKAIEVAIQ